MLLVTQLIYLKEGQEDTFHQFESTAIPIILKYNGQILLRLRPAKEDIIESNIAKPYEVHLIQFPSDTDFENYMNDEARQKILYLKDQSIKSSILVKGYLH